MFLQWPLDDTAFAVLQYLHNHTHPARADWYCALIQGIQNELLSDWCMSGFNNEYVAICTVLLGL